MAMNGVHKNGIGTADKYISWRQLKIIVPIIIALIGAGLFISEKLSAKADKEELEKVEDSLCVKMQEGDNAVRREGEKDVKTLRELIVANQKMIMSNQAKNEGLQLQIIDMLKERNR